MSLRQFVIVSKYEIIKYKKIFLVKNGRARLTQRWKIGKSIKNFLGEMPEVTKLRNQYSVVVRYKLNKAII